MEIANLWARLGNDINGVRIARRDDARAITNLLRNAPYTHIHADWHYPVDWLGLPGFIVADAGTGRANKEDESLASRLFGSQVELQACLAVASDPPPAAWVRVAASIDSDRTPQMLSAMFAAAAESLRQDAVTRLGWLLVEPWPEAWIRSLGFEKENFVETFIKNDSDLPLIKAVPGLLIRPVHDTDLPFLERIEEEAFEPLWRHSVASLALARRHALSFDVAQLDGEVVGYQFSTPVESGAHLARMTIDPAFQGGGIGTLLLAHACDNFHRQGLERISLNTQIDNWASRNLYQRFGFRPSGQRFPVWVADLS
jgi:ribosomal protein S18 acetylase RimI-like enzyme